MQPLAERIFSIQPSLDEPEPVETELEDQYTAFFNLLQGVEISEYNYVVQRKATTPALQATVCCGALFAMLTQHVSLRDTFWQLVVLITKDDYAFLLHRLLQIVTSRRFHLISPQVRQRLFGVVVDVARAPRAHPSINAVLVALLRQCPGGDLRPDALRQHHDTLELLHAVQPWLADAAHPTTRHALIYRALRLGVDLARVKPALGAPWLTIACRLIEAQPLDAAAGVGRDLLRLLYDAMQLPNAAPPGPSDDGADHPPAIATPTAALAATPYLFPEAMGAVWSKLRHPGASRPWRRAMALMQTTPTPPEILAMPITYAMESKLRYFLEAVPKGGEYKLLSWFHARYIHGAPAPAPSMGMPMGMHPQDAARSPTAKSVSEHLYVDIIRFVSACIFPPNQVLASKTLQRWQYFSRILRSHLTSLTTVACAKTALLWDWLFFQPDRDALMRLEPTFLMLYRSAERAPALSASLLDFAVFLVRQGVPIGPDAAAARRRAMNDAMAAVIAGGVLPALRPVLTLTAWSPATVAQWEWLFAPFFALDPAAPAKTVPSAAQMDALLAPTAAGAPTPPPAAAVSARTRSASSAARLLADKQQAHRAAQGGPDEESLEAMPQFSDDENDPDDDDDDDHPGHAADGHDDLRSSAAHAAGAREASDAYTLDRVVVLAEAVANPRRDNAPNPHPRLHDWYELLRMLVYFYHEQHEQNPQPAASGPATPVSLASGGEEPAAAPRHSTASTASSAEPTLYAQAIAAIVAQVHAQATRLAGLTEWDASLWMDPEDPYSATGWGALLFSCHKLLRHESKGKPAATHGAVVADLLFALAQPPSASAAASSAAPAAARSDPASPMGSPVMASAAASAPPLAGLVDDWGLLPIGNVRACVLVHILRSHVFGRAPRPFLKPGARGAAAAAAAAAPAAAASAGTGTIYTSFGTSHPETETSALYHVLCEYTGPYRPRTDLQSATSAPSAGMAPSEQPEAGATTATTAAVAATATTPRERFSACLMHDLFSVLYVHALPLYQVLLGPLLLRFPRWLVGLPDFIRATLRLLSPPQRVLFEQMLAERRIGLFLTAGIPPLGAPTSPPGDAAHRGAHASDHADGNSAAAGPAGAAAPPSMGGAATAAAVTTATQLTAALGASPATAVLLRVTKRATAAAARLGTLIQRVGSWPAWEQARFWSALTAEMQAAYHLGLAQLDGVAAAAAAAGSTSASASIAASVGQSLALDEDLQVYVAVVELLLPRLLDLLKDLETDFMAATLAFAEQSALDAGLPTALSGTAPTRLTSDEQLHHASGLQLAAQQTATAAGVHAWLLALFPTPTVLRHVLTSIVVPDMTPYLQAWWLRSPVRFEQCVMLVLQDLTGVPPPSDVLAGTSGDQATTSGEMADGHQDQDGRAADADRGTIPYTAWAALIAAPAPASASARVERAADPDAMDTDAADADVLALSDRLQLEMVVSSLDAWTRHAARQLRVPRPEAGDGDGDGRAWVWPQSRRLRAQLRAIVDKPAYAFIRENFPHLC
ncbi:hypothetical protein CXG81DRAFT_25265 [Caulochytrium protostelioides]|uniref:Integrator complex subunit 3 N-terminal domain-containing protein n=1 Tax=Caulochytrium protostelioides TaxID=1555241 RepID=A0A4V1IUX8_9FUNG|nr:hypothetical protein CXG81DRAFT_25265 [Caulochytrium protostelioides]|eukprot:RKP02109.1 hypothetical protein CXG81DRAFT_25265 [Caulochytrium protostelioides]